MTRQNSDQTSRQLFRYVKGLRQVIALTLYLQDDEPLRVQGIKLMPPYVVVVAGPVIAIFDIPPFERVKHLCGDAPRLRARQLHRFDSRAHTLMGEFVGFAQNPPVVSDSTQMQPISLLTARARITLVSAKPEEDKDKDTIFNLPPAVSRMRAWTHRTAKPAVIGPSGSRGAWIQRPSGCAPRLIAWTAAKDDIREEIFDLGEEGSVKGNSDTIREPAAAGSTENQENTTARPVSRWHLRHPSNDLAIIQGWNDLPCGHARKVDMYPIKVEDVKRYAFDEGTGRICLGMRNGEVYVLDFT